MTIEDNRIRAAEFLSVWDGDTFHARLQLMPTGTLRIEARVKIRVYRYSAPELSDPIGPAAREQFRQFLESGSQLFVKIRRMSYDRVVADVWLDGVNFAEVMTREVRQLRGLQP